jgi:phosphate/sulfate permease
LFGATFLGIPVSTTHTITGAIAGVGSTTRLSAGEVARRGQIRLGLGSHHSRRRNFRCHLVPDFRVNS